MPPNEKGKMLVLGPDITIKAISLTDMVKQYKYIVSETIFGTLWDFTHGTYALNARQFHKKARALLVELITYMSRKGEISV